MSTNRRLLIYSHDSFGLGHLRRCRAIAHDLVGRFPDLSVLILSGSPIIGSFEFKNRVDFVRVPGVIKLRNGEYQPLKLKLDIATTIEIRNSIIQHTAQVFEPDLFIVDKEPLGLRGEVRSTVEMLRAAGTRCVLGLRDVMDEPASLIEEWDRKGVFPQLHRLYDEIWVYGLPEIFDPLAEIPGFDRLESLVRFTGYLRREPLAAVPVDLGYALPTEPFLLVTTGGGGDGDELIDWVLSAYEADPGIPFAAVVLFGPFLELDHRAALSRRAARLPRIHTLTFESRVEALIERASGIVAMGGYNTFCEILSFGKPALVVPRTEPRLEQLLRAQRAERLGLLRMLEPPAVRDPMVMARALREFVGCAPPAPRLCDRMLCGLDTIAALAEPWLGARVPRARLSRVG